MCNKKLYVQARHFMKGFMIMLPLSIAALPWGILAGSMAINAGLSVAEAMAMPIFMFAGTAQLVSLGLVMAGAPIAMIIVSVFFVTSQHFIYALVFRKKIGKYPLKTRLALGFLLTDELFAIRSSVNSSNRYYLIGAGFCFYFFWVIFNYAGIVVANTVPDLHKYHLDFSIVAIFIPIIIALTKNKATVLGVFVSCVCAFVLQLLQFKSGLIVAGLAGMLVASLYETFVVKHEVVEL